MLKLENVQKTYRNGETVTALKGVSVGFRESEFVSILGPSGCGKTTLLNIIGGLDRYDSGDLIINGLSTKQFKSSDWDAYRNRSIGFVFQSYNLIRHQSVLQNVEIALTLSGVSTSERKRRATQALTDVGLSGQLRKKPNQLSGGQMQRVAIARALMNDPDIILADEPTGALDSQTSVQVMEILKEIGSMHRLFSSDRKQRYDRTARLAKLYVVLNAVIALGKIGMGIYSLSIFYVSTAFTLSESFWQRPLQSEDMPTAEKSRMKGIRLSTEKGSA